MQAYISTTVNYHTFFLYGQDVLSAITLLQCAVKESKPLTVILPTRNLPITQPYLNHHTDKPRNTDTSRVTDRGSAQRELTILRGNPIADLRKGINVYKAAKESFPEDDCKYEPYVRYEVEQSVEGQQDQVGYLEP